MNRESKREVSIKALDGGINKRDTESGILDNQLSDAKNVWYNDGVLRTRPNFITNENMHSVDWSYSNSALFKNNLHKDITYQNKVLLSVASTVLSSGSYKQVIDFLWQGKSSVQHFGYIEFNLESNNLVDYFVSCYSDTVYVYVNNKKIYKKVLGSAVGSFTEVTNKYIPTVMTNALRTGGGTENEPEFSADMVEGYNLIGDYAKIIYSTKNPNYNGTDKTAMKMIYPLPKMPEGKTLSDYAGYKITVKITSNYQVASEAMTVTHEVTLNNSGVGTEATALSDGFRIIATRKSIAFYISNTIALINNEDTQMLNNLEITYPHFSDNSKIFGCTFCEWYGGVSEGINGGTRLFVSGNSANLSSVYWSDLNNPLYFPENNWFNVGTTGSKVTAFGKQNDKLIIFKENEIYYTNYTQTTTPEAEEVQNQSFIDLTTANANFPLVLINSSIGCDCPNTVELCRNRLVFLNSGGNVYEIVTTNQYSENNIYEIGGMIKNKLKSETDLTGAMSADFAGHYCIIIGQNMYLCDYNSYGYQYAYSFKNDDDSQVKIPWYFWELPFEGNYFSFRDYIFFGKTSLIDDTPLTNRGTYYISSVLCEDNADIYDKLLVLIPPEVGGQTLQFNISDYEILSEFETKLFTFGSPDKRKNVERVSIFTGDNEGQQITISFITESGTESENYYTNITDMSECKTVLPYTKSTTKFGIKMSSGGKLAVEGITIIYRMLGVIR